MPRRTSRAARPGAERGQFEGLAGHGGKDQGGNEHVHIEAVGYRHFRFVPAAVAENPPPRWRRWEKNGGDAQGEGRRPSQNVARKILVAGQIAQAGIDISCVDGDRLAAGFSGTEGKLFKKLFHHRPSGAPDVLGFSLTWKAISARRLMPSEENSSRTPLGIEQRLVLTGQTGVGLGQDALEIGHRQRIEFHRMGNGPAIPGIRSEGLDRWKAPDAMNKT